MKKKPRIAGIQRLLAHVIFVGFVLALLLIIFVAKFEYLQAPSALDHAQIARNLASGNGLTTSLMRPLGIALGGADAEKVLFSGPLYPTVLSLPMRVFGATGRVVALMSMLFAVLTAATVYLLSTRAFSERIAVASVAIVVLTVSFAVHAVSGTDIACLTFLVTCLFGLLLVWSRSSSRGSVWWPIGASLIVALCWLIRYEMVVLLPAIIIFWLLSDPGRFWKRLLWTLVPFALIALPWIVRNSLLMDRPIVSASSYMLLSSTNLYPGEGILRMYRSVPYHPWQVALAHPGMMLMKVHSHALQTYSTLTLVGNPYITSFFLFGVLLATVRHRLAALHWTVLLSLLLTAGVLCLYEQASALLVVFVPIMVMLTVKDVADTVADLKWPESSDGEGKSTSLIRRLRGKFKSMQKTGATDRLVTVALVILVLIVAYPMVDYLFVKPPARPSPTVAGLQSLQDRGYDVVLSDAPSAVTWHARTPALLLPADRYALAALEEAGIRPGAVYLSPSQRAERAVFPGYERVENWEYPGVLLERVVEGPIQAEQ